MKKRFDEVDLLRAFGILGVIIVHILTYNLTNPIYKFLWNYLQFVVVAFVFCSGFVLSSIYADYFTSLSKTVQWYKKRFIRLIIPFWIYLVVHFSLWILFPNLFQGLGLVKTPEYFLKSATLLSGTNFNWLPLLFLQLTFLFPIFTNWIKQKKILAVYVAGSIVITTIFSFFPFPYSYYRYVMWIPWSLVLLVSMYISMQAKKAESSIKLNTRYFLVGLIFFVMFLNLLISELGSGKSLNFYDHKYPPDFFYLFFGVSITAFALIIGRAKFWQNSKLKSAYFYVSNNSYQIFFIHYILLDLVLTLARKNTFLQNPILELGIILPVSLIIAEGLNRAQRILKKKN